jgi:hypothetical protein
MCIAGLVLGIVGLVVGAYEIVDARRSGRKLREQTQWAHPALVALKASIEGSNRGRAIKVIDEMLERLQPSKK